MLARSARNPLVIVLGAGIVLIVGNAPPALAADDTSKSPSVSPSGSKPTTSGHTASSKPTDGTSTDSASPTPPAPVLHVKLTRKGSGTIYTDSTVSYTAHVYSEETSVDDVRLSLGTTSGVVSARCTPSAGLCKLGNVNATGETIDFTVAVSATGTVSLSAEAISSSSGADSGVTHTSFKVTKKPTPSKSSTPKPTATATHSSGSNSGSSGSNSGSSGSSSTTTPSGNLNSGTTSGANSTPQTAPQNNAVLPNVPQNQTQGQTNQAPSTAPLLENAGNSQSMQNAADGANELTFDKLASTQAAWLAALLVAFGLLLTQVRLGKATNRSVKAVPKPKGTHRKPRGGTRRAH
ncbi:hypothetical protein AB0L00_21320 [Actinoallomurus sp. NPDC052308]|uniref:hypothetical protein n=1 Tax=Actinoallomurus sp. NPDC052308 TaxID=3155530 RepID=UPI003422FB04